MNFDVSPNRVVFQINFEANRGHFHIRSIVLYMYTFAYIELQYSSVYTYLEVITVNGCSGSSSLFAFVDHLWEFQNKGFPFDLFNSTNGNIRKHIIKHSCKINYRELYKT